MPETSPTWYELADDGTYAFPLQRGSLTTDNDATNLLGSYLLDGLVDLGFVQALATTQGLDQASRYLRQRKLTADARARMADFGEISAGRLLEHFEGLARPIEKLRYKDRNDLPLHLTDILCARMNNGTIEEFVFAEVKAGATRPHRDLGKKALRSIVSDWQSEMPEILYFVLEKLCLEGRNHDQAAFEDAMFRAEPMPRTFRVVLVFDGAIWDENVLADMHTDYAEGKYALGEFKCYLLTADNLRTFVDSTFEAAHVAGTQA